MIVENYDPQTKYERIILELPIGIPREEAFERCNTLLDAMNATLETHGLDQKAHWGTDYGLGVPDEEAHMCVYIVLPVSNVETMTVLEQVMKALEPELTPERTAL
jgi:hypothetical protein